MVVQGSQEFRITFMFWWMRTECSRYPYSSCQTIDMACQCKCYNIWFYREQVRFRPSTLSRVPTLCPLLSRTAEERTWAQSTFGSWAALSPWKSISAQPQLYLSKDLIFSFLLSGRPLRSHSTALFIHLKIIPANCWNGTKLWFFFFFFVAD